MLPRSQSRKGVKKVVQVEDYAVAVIADSWWRAKTALDAMPIVWDEGDNAKVSSAVDRRLAQGRPRRRPGLVGNKGGDVKAALASAAKKVEAVYAYPYQNHATMEPQNATARYTADKCEVWCSTQNGEAALATASEASGLPVPKCEVYKTFLGGGFGRRSTSHDYVRQAVLIAKEMPGTPVKLLWTREEDMTHDWYHPVTQCKITAGFDKDNNLIAIHYRISGQSILATVAPARMQEGRDPATFSGFYAGRRGGGVRLHDAEHPGGPFDAQPASAPGILARREHQSQRDLHRMLHGRTCQGSRHGRAGVPAQADGQSSSPPRRHSTRLRKRAIGASRCRPEAAAALPRPWFSAATSPPVPRCPSTTTR